MNYQASFTRTSDCQNDIRLPFVLLLVMTVVMAIIVFTFVYFMVRAAKRDMYLCGALIKQMEATQQAERKSMHKSLAFASASHDIRASLAGITGLVEICLDEVSKRDHARSELQTNLLQMKACTEDLLDILNSMLDTSKIEAGKLQLEEEEFDIEQVLENMVDLYHPVGMKKGVDVILDPCDGSVTKSSRVRGDRVRLKQVLCNLLSNTVKFTSEVHVTVRAWPRKPTFENAILASSSKKFMSYLSRLFFKIDRTFSKSEVSSSTQKDLHCLEFVFEVNDTGNGIRRRRGNLSLKTMFKSKRLWRNNEELAWGSALFSPCFIQFSEFYCMHLVLGSIHLMGGEIEIVDKEVGEKGTRFRFYVFFSTCNTDNSTPARETDIEVNSDYISCDSSHHSGPIMHTHTPKTEGSHVLLFLQSAKRTNILHNFMKRLGLKVHIVKKHELLSPTLKKIKQKLNSSRHNSSSVSDLNSRSDKEVPLSSLDGMDNVLSSQKKANFVLIVIDTHAGPFREISRGVAEFRKNLNTTCSRIVWLDIPLLRSDNFQGLNEDKLPLSDLCMSKPLHGSRLYRIMGLLPEFGGIPIQRRVEVNAGSCSVVEASTSGVKAKIDIESCTINKGKIEEFERPSSRNPLTGKKILAVDNDSTGRRIAVVTARKLGATVFFCENGKEACALVCKNLDNGTTAVAPGNIVPYDCILMDCQMPVMDGIEATWKIRQLEKNYGVRIPIIALTAHERGQEVNMMIQAGVDGYLTKPLT